MSKKRKFKANNYQGGSKNMKFKTHIQSLNPDGTSIGPSLCDSNNVVILYTISRLEIETCDTDRIVHDLSVNSGSPFVKCGMGNIIFMVEGYDSDDREMYLIPEFRRWMAKAEKLNLCWLYYSNVESYWLQTALLSITNNLVVEDKSEICALYKRDVQAFLDSQIERYEELCNVANKTSEESERHLESALRKFNILNQ